MFPFNAYQASSNQTEAAKPQTKTQKLEHILHQCSLSQKSSLLYLLAHGFSHGDEGMKRWRVASGGGKAALDPVLQLEERD